MDDQGNPFTLMEACNVTDGRGAMQYHDECLLGVGEGVWGEWVGGGGESECVGWVRGE